SKMHVTIGGTEVKLVSCSDTELSFYVPNTFVAGVYDVVIMRTDTQETKTVQYEYTAVASTPMTVTGISPSSGEELMNQKVTVTGQNFASVSKMQVTVGGTAVTLVSCSDTELSFYVPNTLAAGTYDVVVTRTDTQESGIVQYTCTAKPVDPSPVVSSVTPTTGAENSSTKVIITGTALRGGTKSTTVTFDGQDVKLTSNTDTEVSFYTPQLVAGTYDIVITNSYGKSVTISFDIQ
ncbi:MAG: IPT/TIG domain-containing protein, partial [Lachnospiraceae bacterium]|nr:IPT/TIG domain-containing protein [Lachnospiraceae bacterium]